MQFDDEKEQTYYNLLFPLLDQNFCLFVENQLRKGFFLDSFHRLQQLDHEIWH